MIDELVFFSIGGNMGDRLALIEETYDFIDFNIGDVILKSKIYETEAWGMPEGTPSFYNQILGVKTNLTPAQIAKEIQEIDEYYGRVRNTEGYSSREMDVDVIYYKNQIHQEPLIIPHPKMSERLFILKPLTEIAPDFIHPMLNFSNAELLKKCTDSSKVIEI